MAQAAAHSWRPPSVLFTAGQLGFERFHLSVPASGAGPAATLLIPAAHDSMKNFRASSESSQGNVDLRSLGGSSIVAFILTDGILLKESGGKLGPDCKLGDGLTVKAWDYAALVACLQTLRRTHALASPPIGTIAGSSGTLAATVLHVANAMRCGEVTCAPGRTEPPLVDVRYFGVSR